MLTLPPRWKSALRYAAPALAGYVAVRVFCVLLFAGWAWLAGEDPYTLLSGRWDAVWYGRIAADGYGFVARVPPDIVHPDYAFFPLFPWLMRLVAAVTPLSLQASGLVLSWLASVAAAWGLFAVGAHVAGRRAGIVLAILWGALPIAIVESMAYTETLFTALSAWALYAVLTRRWLVAGLLTLVAGLTRPAAVALIAAVGLTALISIVRSLRAGSWRECVRPFLGAALSPLGFLAYVGWVGARVGSVTGYFEVQAQWNKSLDLGQAAARQIWTMLSGPLPWVGVLVLLAYVLVLALFAWSAVRFPVAALVAYTAGNVYLALFGTGYFNSRPRLLVPAFALLLPFAVALARSRRGVAVGVLVGLTLVSAVYGGYMLVVGQAPP
ncbi:hypothetical protein [Flindersiella endophytica]